MPFSGDSKGETRGQVLDACQELEKELKNINYSGSPIRVEIDDRDLRGGEKYWQWVKKESRYFEIGPEILKIKPFSGRRDRGAKREEFL